MIGAGVSFALRFQRGVMDAVVGEFVFEGGDGLCVVRTFLEYDVRGQGRFRGADGPDV